MFNMGSAPSLSDIAAVTKDGNGDGWGNGNGWWVLIILFAIFGGWGNGWGGQGRNGEGCATNGDLQRGFDTQSILNKLSGIDNGICDGFYAINTSYGLLDDIHKVVKPEYWILAEEWVCNFIADYGAKIFSIAYSILGNDAWMFIPYELDKVIA